MSKLTSQTFLATFFYTMLIKYIGSEVFHDINAIVTGKKDNLLKMIIPLLLSFFMQ